MRFPRLSPLALAAAAALFFLASAACAQQAADARVLILGVLYVEDEPIGGSADWIVCRAAPGEGKVYMVSDTVAGPDGEDLLKALAKSVIALRTEARLPGGARADYTRFDLFYEVADDDTPMGGGSLGLAAGITAFSAMTKKPLRPNVAVTGAIGIDGGSGQIGGMEYKIEAALEKGAEIIIIPASQADVAMRLPLDLRLSAPIFPVRNLNEALATALVPRDPESRAFDAYLTRQKAAIRQFVEVYDEFEEKHGRLPYLDACPPEIERELQLYIEKNPNAAGRVFTDIDDLIRQFPLNIALRSISEVSRRLRAVYAADDEVERGKTLSAAGKHLEAYAAYEQARRLHPEHQFVMKLRDQAAEAHFSETLKSSIEDADEKHRRREFAAAAEAYQSLAKITQGYHTRFPVMQSLMEARLRAEADPQNPELRRHAGSLAQENGVHEAAIEEYTALLRLETSAENAGLLFRTLLAAEAAPERSDPAVSLRRVKDRAEELAASLPSGAAARIRHGLADVFLEKGDHTQASELLQEVFASAPSAAVATSLLTSYLAISRALPAEQREASLAKASDVVDAIVAHNWTSPELHRIREALDLLRGKDTTPPLIEVKLPSDSRTGQLTVRGVTSLRVSLRDGAGTRSIRVRLGTTQVVELNDPNPESAILWDSSRHLNGVYPLTLIAVDAHGNESRVELTCEVANSIKTTVYGSLDTKKYHLAHCRFVPSSGAGGRREVLVSPLQAQTHGFKPCIYCIPKGKNPFGG
ncbi:MAG: S16 family serine protease [Armatimonadota bacterium]